MNTRMQEDVFDLVLKYALLDCANEDIAALKQEEKMVYTETFSKNIEKLVSKRKRALTLMAVPKWTRRAAACLVMIFTVFSAVLFTAPPVQAAVQEVIVEWTDRYVDFHFAKKPNDRRVSDINLGYLPDGFQLESHSIKERGISHFYYTNQSEGKIKLTCAAASMGYNTDVDNEHGTLTDIDLKKKNVLFLKSTVVGYSSYLTWLDDGLFFTLVIPGDMETDEIKKIAENILVEWM